MKKILIAHDGSKSSDKALKRGLEIAEKFNSAVTVITVIPSLYLTELMEVDRDRILKALSEDQKFLLGSVSSKIIDHATCNVLVVKK
jgi:nucleotide-binding universal stress UspA family protein